MNDKPQRGQDQGSTGFKVNIDQKDLMTGAFEQPRARRRVSVSLNDDPPSSVKKTLSTEKERKAEKKAHKKRNRLKARKNKRVFSFMWLCMVLLASFTLASYLINGSNDFFGASRPEGTADIEIPQGKLTEEKLADILYEAGIIQEPEFFTLYCKVRAHMENFAPGPRSKVSTNLDYEALLNTLIGGDEDLEEVQVVFPEGFTALQAARLLEENEVCKAQEFLDALNNLDFTQYDAIAALGDTSGKYYKVEGYLFPDTYNFYKGEELDSVIGKLLYNFQRKINDKLLQKVQESGMTLDQVVTMASIIQAEAANEQDMFNVSAVLHNRLNFGADYDIYFLECDSTSFYPYRNAKDLEEQGGTLSYGNYDTYKISGLPAGAICNPGIDAINAALKPNTGGDAEQYLYFCHSDEGVAYYATNESDHEYNKQLAGIS